MPVVSEQWLIDSIDKQEPQPLEAYDIVSDLGPDGRGIPWDKMDPSEEAIESLSAKVHNSFETIFTGYFVSKAHLYSNIMICVAAQAVWEESCL